MSGHTWAKYQHNSLQSVIICTKCNAQKSSLDLKSCQPCEGCDCGHGQEGYEGDWVFYPCPAYPSCPEGKREARKGVQA